MKLQNHPLKWNLTPHFDWYFEFGQVVQVILELASKWYETCLEWYFCWFAHHVSQDKSCSLSIDMNTPITFSSTNVNWRYSANFNSLNFLIKLAWQKENAPFHWYILQSIWDKKCLRFSNLHKMSQVSKWPSWVWMQVFWPHRCMYSRILYNSAFHSSWHLLAAIQNLAVKHHFMKLSHLSQKYSYSNSLLNHPWFWV